MHTGGIETPVIGVTILCLFSAEDGYNANRVPCLG